MSPHRLCALDELTHGEARRFEVDGTPLAVVRIGDMVHAIGDICSHAEISLSEGEVDPEQCSLECWKHGSTFSLVTGMPQSLPATKPVPVYEARVVGGQVEVEVQ